MLLIASHHTLFVVLHVVICVFFCSVRAFGEAPEVTVLGRTGLTFPYVSNHINYIIYELLKNSMRATVEFHRNRRLGDLKVGEKNSKLPEGLPPLPKIKIVIADGEDNEDVSS